MGVKYTDSSWEEGDDFFAAKAEQLRELSNEVLMSLETQALALREWFREERKRLQREGTWTTDSTKRKLPGGEWVSYAPINLFVKTRDANLEIFWQEVHLRSKGSIARRYIYLSRGKSFKYSDSKLRRSAQPFELDLVLATEQRAAHLREMWSIWAGVHRAHRNATKLAKPVTAVAPVVEGEWEDAQLPALVPAVEK